MPENTRSTHVADMVGITVTQEHGEAITKGNLAPKSPCLITVLTDRETGAQIRMDDTMLSYFLYRLPNLPNYLPDDFLG